MNSSVLVKSGGFVAPSLLERVGNRPGVVAALFTALLFLAGCGGSSKSATPTPIFTPAAGSYSATQYVTVSDTSQNAVLYCTNDGSAPTTSSTQCANPITVSQSQTLNAIAVAPGMSPSAMATAQYTISTTAAAPTVTAIGPTTGPSTGGTSVTIIGTGFTGATAVNFGTVPATSFTVNSGTSITAVSPADTGTVNVTVVTAAGTSATGSADLFAYEIPATPTITNLTPNSGLAGSTVAIIGTNFGTSQGSSTVTFNGTSATSISLWTSTSIVAVVPAGATTGNVVVTVGGVASVGVPFTVTLPAPTIAQLTPSSGVVGTSVGIIGTNFGTSQGTSTVTFNGAAAAITSWSPTAIVALIPTGATTGNVVVTVGGVASAGVPFTVTLPAPTIASLSASSGSVGSLVTITGTNFGTSQGTSTVTFNGTAATAITSWSATSITAQVPTGATTGNVVVTVGGVASNGLSFTVNTAGPTISGLSESSGSVGSSVTITGTNFGAPQGTSTVTFNGTAATTITSWSATSITAQVPTGATTGNVVVTVNGLASNGEPFTVTVPTPSISGLSESSGAVGDSVTITGTNFGASQGSSTVTFNGTSATTITNWSATSITAQVPTGATTGDVVVTVDGAASDGEPFTVLTTISGYVLSGPNTGTVTPISANIQLYAAGTTGYGTGQQPIGSSVQTNASTGAFSGISYDCSTLTAPGDQLYLVATSKSSNSIVLMTALGSCTNVATSFPSGVTINEATTIASAFALAGFANVNSGGNGIDIGAPATGASCTASAGWVSTGVSTCNYIGLKNAFATVTNLVDIPSGQALAVTPAYCTSTPCFTAANTTPYYATSIVPQGRINAMANALADCANPTSGSPANCSTLLTATTIEATNDVDVTCSSSNLYTPTDTLQAALNIAHFPGDRAYTACGVDVNSGTGIYSLIPSTPPYAPTLTSSTHGSSEDLSLALIFQGGGLGGPSNDTIGVNGSPETAGLAIDAGGNIWVPTMSSTGGSVAVLNNQGAPITASGNANGFGGYTTGVYNPQSIAIDQNGNAWIGNSPADGNHSQSDYGSLSEINLSGSTLTTPQNGLTAAAVTVLLTPSPYGLAIDASNNVWISSNPGVGGFSSYGCVGGTYGGGILEFNSSGNLLNGPNGYLSYSDNSSCPTALAFDESGLLWTWDNAETSGSDPNQGVVQLAPASGAVAGGPYNVQLQNPSYGGNNFCTFDFDQPSSYANMTIDSLGDSWFAGGTQDDGCMFVIPNMTTAGASAAISQGTWGSVLYPDSSSVTVNGPTVIDGGDNAWATDIGGYLIGYNSENVSSTYNATATDTALLSPQNGPLAGFAPTDHSANASGRTGGTEALSQLGYGKGLGVDGSGNLWVSGEAYGYGTTSGVFGSQLTEFIGIAVPAQTPLATALKSTELGQKP